MKNAIELIRVSTERQAGEDRAGIPAQREINRRTARTYGLNIVRTIEIVDVSGATVLASPQMQELLQLMESPGIHGVVTKEFSRLIRPEKFTDYALLQHFIDTSTVLYLPDGPIDLASKTGRLLGTIRAAIAGMERREIIERMQDAKEAMRKAGKHPGGETSLPYGVGYSEEKGWHYTAEGEKVKQAFALFLCGHTSYMEIGRKLNIPRTSLRYILENPIYAGWRVYDEKRDPAPLAYVPGPDGRQGYRRKTKRPPEEVIRVRVLDGLVSEQDFARVQQLVALKRQRHWRVRGETPTRYTYNGFLACGDCASLLYTHTARDEFYLCKSHHTRERRRRDFQGLSPCSNRYMLRKKLEPRIDYLLGEKLREPDFLRRVVDEHNEEVERSSKSAGGNESAITARLNALTEKKQRVLETFFEGVIDKQERDRRLEETEREIIAYQGLLAECVPRRVRRPEDVEASLEPFGEWEFLERDDKRALLAMICPEISVYRYTVKSLVLNLDVSPAGGDKVSRSKTARSPSPERPSP